MVGRSTARCWDWSCAWKRASFDAVVGTTLGSLAPLLPRRSFQFGHVVFEIRYLRLQGTQVGGVG